MSADDPHNAFDDLTPQDDDAGQAFAPDADEDEALDFHESAPLEQETPPANGPASAAPPRIVAEAPLGGVPKPVVSPIRSKSPGATSPDIEPDQPAPEPDPAPVAAAEDALPEPDPVPDDDAPPDAAVEDTPPEPVLAEEPPVAPLEPEASTTESTDLAARVRKFVTDTDAARTPAPDQPPRDAAPPSPAPAPAPVEGVGMADVSDFDDISPELAKILGKAAAPDPTAPPAETKAAPEAEIPAVSATPDAAPAAPHAPEPEPDAPAIQLTDIAEVRHLPITAEQCSAPAPDTTLTGKVRYVRVEEPLRNDEGQRIQESWEYLKPGYPALGGRLVKAITIEEIAYSDGSWEWRYERRYTDKGRDVREVRANADRTYIEREDEVSRLDAETGRRLQFREEAELIFAAREKEEKRGGLLGGLFGRGDDDDDDDHSPKVWRDATSSESKQARKQGGEAFKRGGFLGL